MNNSHVIRKYFPLLFKEGNEKVIYLDNAATTLKPKSVLEKIIEFYSEYPVNVHRSAHSLAERASSEFENSRELARCFFNAKKTSEIIFTKGTTDAINLVANSFGSQFIHKGDEIILTQMEHHANIVPWKRLSERIGAILKIIPITSSGELDLNVYEQHLSSKTRLVSTVYVSNSLGTINPIKRIIQSAHARGAKVLVDAAQAVSHFPIDVQALDADFLCCSGHKMFGPFGVGILYGKEELLEQMPPYQGGGGMIQNVSFDSISYAGLPNKFEAGTPPICSIIGLGEAIKFLQRIGFEKIGIYEDEIVSYTKNILEEIEGLKILGQTSKRCPIFSFQLDGVHPHDISTFLDQRGIAIRSGHHCNQPIMDYYKIPACSRASLAFYNTKEEVDELAAALNEVKGFFI